MIAKVLFVAFIATVCAVPIRVVEKGHNIIPRQAQNYHIEPKGHAVSSQSYVSHHSPSDHKSSEHEEDYDHHPSYKFEYSVHDDHTKDIKSQHETRDGDQVQGEYSFLQPDGHYRKVTYHADKHNGFNADVAYTGH